MEKRVAKMENKKKINGKEGGKIGIFEKLAKLAKLKNVME